MARRSATIELSEGVLTIAGELDWSKTAQFDEECQRLLAGDAPRPVIDLTGVHTLTSPFLGILSQTAVQCLGTNKPLTLRVPARLLSLFHTLNFEKFANLEVV